MNREQMQKAVLDLGELVRDYGGDSALNGLTLVAGAFGILLETYANPNPDNELGMCDDPVAFRRYFAEIVAGRPDATRTNSVGADVEPPDSGGANTEKASE